MITESAPAKINLALHVTGRREDGYHLLDSLVAFAPDAADMLRMEPARATHLEIGGPFAADLDSGPDNLVLRALSALGEARPGKVGGCRIELTKNLPVASGIGGGSADAAAALRAAIALYRIEITRDDLAGLALLLGADVPVCLSPVACRMQGIGETILAAPAVEGLQAVLVNPGVPVSTAGIFRSLNIEPGAGYRDGLGDPGPAGSHIRLDWLAGCRNDLEAPARQLQPVIGEVIDALAATPNCRLARMSGSGATCFGIFENPADAASAARRLSQAHPGWWVQASRLA